MIVFLKLWTMKIIIPEQKKSSFAYLKEIKKG
jgi:hypothetical protein